MQIGGKTKIKKPVHEKLSYMVQYKKQESDDWKIDQGLSKYQAKIRAQSLLETYPIVETYHVAVEVKNV